MRRLLKPVRNERGATFVFFAMLTGALLSLGALAADTGLLYMARSEAQRAAEAAALAGAGLYKGVEVPTKAQVETKARDYAGKNYVGTAYLSKNDTSVVKVEVFEAQQRVRVTVNGTAPLMFARLIGIAQMPVSAVAAARVTGAGGATCVKPFTIPDLWEEKTGGSDKDGDQVWDSNETWEYTPGVDRYKRWADPESNDMTGYGSQFRKDYNRDQGRRITIKVTNPQDNTQIEPGLFFPWDMPGSNKGGSDYRANIAACNDSTITLGREYDLKPGDMKGPTFQGMQDLIALDPKATWDEANNKISSTMGMNSPRVIKIALFDPEEVSKSGRQKIRFNNIALLFIEEQKKQQDPVIARFIKYADGVSAGNGSLVRRLQLVE
ncbi:MAG TPA: pilus assembly protein TadG-related protein [Longimicrobiaceae bacterium]|jgi:hypothetical protein